MLQKIWYGSNIYLVEQIYFLIYLGDVIMVAILDRQYGYGQWGNPAEVVEVYTLPSFEIELNILYPLLSGLEI